MGLKSRHELPFSCENPIYNLTIQGRIVKFNFSIFWFSGKYKFRKTLDKHGILLYFCLQKIISMT